MEELIGILLSKLLDQKIREGRHDYIEEKDNEQWSWYKVLDRLSGESFVDMEIDHIQNGVDFNVAGIRRNAKSISVFRLLGVVVEPVRGGLVRLDALGLVEVDVGLVVDVGADRVSDHDIVGHVKNARARARGAVERADDADLVLAGLHREQVVGKARDDPVGVAVDRIQHPGSPSVRHRCTAVHTGRFLVLQRSNTQHQGVDVLPQVVDQDRAGL